MKKQHTSESGQVLVLLVLGVVVLFGFAALAVDGGMVYSDRRHAQMGSDASSLAGGGAAALYMENHHVVYGNFTCDNANVIAAQNSTDSDNPGAKMAAIARATDNDYIIDDNIGDNHGVTTECGVEDHGGWSDKYIDIKTMITRDTETSFAQFVFSGIMRNTVEAVTRVRPRSPAVFGHAIVALNPAGCQGQQNGAGFHGTGDVNVTGGGIFSNGCLSGDGGPDVNVFDGSINYGGEVDDPQLFDPSPSPSEVLPGSSYLIPPPNCANGAWNGTGNQLEALSPLEPGLYCVTGDLSINANHTFSGTHVTIFMENGGLTINGNAYVHLTAPVADPDNPPDPAIVGVLIYAPQTNHEEIQLNGTGDSYFEGTVYAPGANINLLGNDATDAFHTQLIGWNVEVGGTADANVVFSAPQQYSRPALLELYK
jgi:hypothetical protein